MSLEMVLSFVAACFMIGISILGVLGNILSFLVYLRPKFRSYPFCILVASRCVSEFLVIVFTCPVLLGRSLYFYGAEYDDYRDYLWDWIRVYVRPLATTFMSFSGWLLILILLERWFSIYRVQFHSKHIGTTLSLIAILLTLTFAIIFNLVRFWEYRWVPGKTVTAWMTLEKHLQNSTLYWTGYARVGSTIFNYLLPIIVFFLLISCLLRTTGPNISDHPILLEEGGIVSLLLLQVIVFTVSHLIPTIYHSPEGGSLAEDLAGVLILFNSAIGILAYIWFSNAFRQEAKWYFLKCCFTRAERENRFTRSVRNLDRREGGSVRINELSRSQQNALRGSIYAKRIKSNPLQPVSEESIPMTSAAKA